MCQRRPVEPAADPLRDHAGRRHPDAARRGRPPGRLAGPPAEPAAVRPGRRAGGRGLRRAPAEDQLPPDGGHALAVRRASWRPPAASTPIRRRPPTPTWTSSASARFTGKGIYDVDAFEAATGETFPENHILSHDLIEGNYARCGLLSDTELFDDFPARYHAYARREHRWVRGDWQLLPWLGRACRWRTLGRARLVASHLAYPARTEADLQAALIAPPGPAHAIRCRSWSAGSCWTTSAAAWSRPLCSCSWSWAGRSCPARRGPGRRWRWPVFVLPLFQMVAVGRDRQHPLRVARRR